MWLDKKWWKWLCVALLFYVVVGSFMVRLGPGITKVEPAAFSPDSLYTFQITGYHSHFMSPGAGKVQVFFKSGFEFYCPVNFKIISDTRIDATFSTSSAQKFMMGNFDIVINDQVDGTFALREAVTLIKQEKTYPHRTGSSNVASGSLDSIPFDAELWAHQCPHTAQNDKAQFLSFPYREILYETIRNTFFHVPMWFVMTVMVMFSLLFSIVYLASGKMWSDIYAHQAIVVALLFGILGLLTGMIWANYTWGHPWVNDIKLNGAAIGVLIYFAYIILRGSVTDQIKRARISAVYNIFAIVIFMLFIYIMPRLMSSLHPGNGGNPAFSKYDLDNTLRIFFYPAVIGWILLGFWILSILIRMEFIKQKQES